MDTALSVPELSSGLGEAAIASGLVAGRSLPGRSGKRSPAGRPAVASLEGRPPVTNRGYLSPSRQHAVPNIGEVISRPDYLKTTIFQVQAWDVRAFVVDHVFERLCLPSDWEMFGVGRHGRVSLAQGAAETSVEEFRQGDLEFCCLELKGTACAALGAEGVNNLVRQLHFRGWRHRPSRFDWSWDHSGVSPDLVRKAYESGRFVSKALRRKRDMHWRENEEGRTCQLGSRKDERHLRAYDRRGFNRVELEMHRVWAEWCGLVMDEKPVDEWEASMMSAMRSYVDFTKTVPDVVHPERAKLVPWWSEFVHGVKKLEKRGLPSRVRPAVIEKFERWEFVNCRKIAVGVRAYGREWLDRIVSRGESELRVEDVSLAEELAGYRSLVNENACPF